MISSVDGFNTPISVKGEVHNRAGIVSLSYTLDFILNHDS